MRWLGSAFLTNSIYTVGALVASTDKLRRLTNCCIIIIIIIIISEWHSNLQPVDCQFTALKVKGPDVYTPPLTGKTKQQRFTIQSGVLNSTSSRWHGAIGSFTGFTENQLLLIEGASYRTSAL